MARNQRAKRTPDGNHGARGNLLLKVSQSGPFKKRVANLESLANLQKVVHKSSGETRSPTMGNQPPTSELPEGSIARGIELGDPSIRRDWESALALIGDEDAPWTEWRVLLDRIFGMGIPDATLTNAQIELLASNRDLRSIFFALVQQRRRARVNETAQQAYHTAMAILSQNMAEAQIPQEPAPNPQAWPTGTMDVTSTDVSPEFAERWRKLSLVLQNVWGNSYEVARDVELSNIFFALWQNAKFYGFMQDAQSLLEMAQKIKAKRYAGSPHQQILTYNRIKYGRKLNLSSTTMLPNRTATEPPADWLQDMQNLAGEVGLDDMQKWQIANSVPLRQGYTHLGEAAFGITANRPLRFDLALKAARDIEIQRLNEAKRRRERRPNKPEREPPEEDPFFRRQKNHRYAARELKEWNKLLKERELARLRRIWGEEVLQYAGPEVLQEGYENRPPEVVAKEQEVLRRLIEHILQAQRDWGIEFSKNFEGWKWYAEHWVGKYEGNEDKLEMKIEEFRKKVQKQGEQDYTLCQDWGDRIARAIDPEVLFNLEQEMDEAILKIFKELAEDNPEMDVAKLLTLIRYIADPQKRRAIWWAAERELGHTDLEEYKTAKEAARVVLRLPRVVAWATDPEDDQEEPPLDAEESDESSDYYEWPSDMRDEWRRDR